MKLAMEEPTRTTGSAGRGSSAEEKSLGGQGNSLFRACLWALSFLRVDNDCTSLGARWKLLTKVCLCASDGLWMYSSVRLLQRTLVSIHPNRRVSLEEDSAASAHSAGAHVDLPSCVSLFFIKKQNIVNGCGSPCPFAQHSGG